MMACSCFRQNTSGLQLFQTEHFRSAAVSDRTIQACSCFRQNTSGLQLFQTEHFRPAAISDRSFSCVRHWLGVGRGWLSIDFLSSTPYILEVAKTLVFNPFNNNFYICVYVRDFHCSITSWDNHIDWWLQAGEPKDRSSIPARGQRFFFLLSDQDN
jgi:hypothetical protein